MEGRRPDIEDGDEDEPVEIDLSALDRLPPRTDRPTPELSRTRVDGCFVGCLVAILAFAAFSTWLIVSYSRGGLFVG